MQQRFQRIPFTRPKLMLRNEKQRRGGEGCSTAQQARGRRKALQTAQTRLASGVGADCRLANCKQQCAPDGIEARALTLSDPQTPQKPAKLQPNLSLPVAMSSARCCPLTMACTAVATFHSPMDAASALPLPQGICANGKAASGCQSGRASMPCSVCGIGA